MGYPKGGMNTSSTPGLLKVHLLKIISLCNCFKFYVNKMKQKVCLYLNSTHRIRYLLFISFGKNRKFLEPVEEAREIIPFCFKKSRVLKTVTYFYKVEVDKSQESCYGFN